MQLIYLERIELFKPNIYVNHVKDIEYENLKKKGIKLLCFDLDNTLDPADIITEFIQEDIKRVLKKVSDLDFEIFVISNNAIKKRVDSFLEITKLNGVYSAKKPFQNVYKKNEIINKYEKNEVVFIGDKIVTDVIGGNIFGSMTILVDPLVPSKNHWYSIIMNFCEKLFCKAIGFKRGEYYGEKKM